MCDRIKAWFRHSITILWARLVAVIGLLLAAGESVTVQLLDGTVFQDDVGFRE